MHRAIPTYPPSHCRHHPVFVADDNGIGELFRQQGEAYIKSYNPPLHQIKLIRSIRICKTPAMGGKAYICQNCNDRKYIYFSCGNSQCPKCQGIKRIQWQDKLARRLLDTPYVHMVFTMPHLLNRLARDNPHQIYNCLLRTAWSSLKECCEDQRNLGALPGAVMVLHTFGADLKYHCHVHALVTFGGIDQYGKWKWPKRKKKIIPFRQIRKTFRLHFLKKLEQLYPTLKTRQAFNEIQNDLLKKQWCVHAELPTTNSKHIEQYLGRYICRIGLSKNRFRYDQINQSVTLTFKDYRNKNPNTDQIPVNTRQWHPLVAIHQILQHCLPPWFQKCRYYGLHAAATQKKYHTTFKSKLKNNQNTIRTLFQIIKTMIGIDPSRCDNCQHDQFDIQTIKPDKQWIKYRLPIPTNKGSPQPNKWQIFRKPHQAKHKQTMTVSYELARLSPRSQL